MKHIQASLSSIPQEQVLPLAALLYCTYSPLQYWSVVPWVWLCMALYLDVRKKSSKQQQYSVILHTTVVFYFFPYIEINIQQIKPSRSLTFLKGEGHSVYILKPPRHEDLPQRSTNAIFLQDPGIGPFPGGGGWLD